MGTRVLLEPSEVSRRMRIRSGWSTDESGKIMSRSLRFTNFKQAFAFMTEVALWAEQLDHHPDWSNAYNRVDITLTTHDSGGLSALDFSLAERIDEVASRFNLVEQAP